VRIGIFTEYYYPSIGGIQEHVFHFAREARRLGHTVKVITSEMPDLQDGHREEDVLRIGASLPVYVNGGFGRVTCGPRVARAVRDVLERERFDVVHVHAPLTPVLPLVAIHHAAGPVVGTFHTHFHPGLLFRLMRGGLQRYLDRLDAAVAVSYDDDKLNVLFVGRLEPRNGLDRVLAAFARAHRQIPARLLVLGDGPLMPRYRAMVPEELEEDVVFAGRVIDERPDWYATADVYCAPTRIASFGVTLLEAMAAARPVLASDIDGYREVLQHGVEGELLPPDDPDAWARAMVRLARDPARAAAYGERGRATAQRYAWPAVTRDILQVYRSIGVAG